MQRQHGGLQNRKREFESFLLLQCSGGEVVNVSVCKTDIRGFESLSELKIYLYICTRKTVIGYGTDIYLLYMLATLPRLRRLCHVRK